MNKIYTLVWNRSLKQLVVASERATSGGANTVDRRRSMPGGLGASRLATAIVPILAAALGPAALLNPASALAGTCLQLEAQGDGTETQSDASVPTTCAAFSVAIGTNAYASADNAIAIGTDAVADSADAVAIGTGSTATGGRAVSIGAGNTANGNGAVAIGDPNTATGNGAVAQGMDNTGTGDGSVAIGNTNLVGGGGQGIGVAGTAAQGAVGIGYQNNVVGQGSVGGGNANRATGLGVLAIGNTNTAGNTAGPILNPAGANGAVALGSGNYAGDYFRRTILLSPGTGAVAIGLNNTAEGTATIAIGVGARASNNRIFNIPVDSGATAIGSAAVATSGSLALGANTNALQGTVAVGNNARGTGFTTAVGYDAQGGTNSVALGRAAQADLVLISARGTSSSVAIGDSSRVFMSDVTDLGGMVAIGFRSTVSRSAGIALGANANVSAPNGLAIGLRAAVSGQNGTALGVDSIASGVNGIALGNGARAQGANSISVGTGSVVSGANSGAFGDPNIVSGTGSYAFGNDNTIANNNAFVLGNNVTTTQNNSVVLGNASTDRAATTVTGATIAGTAYTYAGPGSVANGVVSVGAAGAERQLINVAAGEVSATSTDAINGSQLFATHQAIEQLSTAISIAGARYYSVNSTGGGNLANDGATGADAIAAGKDAEADGDEAVALGLGAVAAGDGSLAFGAGAQAMALNSLAFGAGAMATHANSIALGAGSATTVGAQSGYAGAFVGASNSTGEMNIGGRQVTGVAAGSAASDAVNVSQLQGGVDYAINQANTYTDTQIQNVNGAIINLDNRVTSIEGDITDIRSDVTQIQGDIVDIQGDIVDLGDRVTTVETDVQDLSSTVNQFDNRITSVEQGGDGIFQVSQEAPIVKPTPTGANSAAGGNGAVASGDNSVAVGNQAQATAANSTAIGRGATATHNNSVALGQGSATTVGAQRGYDAAFVGSSNSTGEVNLGGRTITGVAPGIAGTDAVNVSQLRTGVNTAVQQANAYTDSRFAQFEGDIWVMNDDLRRDMHAAVASAMAVKQAPWVPGKTSYYAGVAGYRDQGAVGISLRRTADNGRWSLEGGFTSNRDGQGAYIGLSGVLGD